MPGTTEPSRISWIVQTLSWVCTWQGVHVRHGALKARLRVGQGAGAQYDRASASRGLDILSRDISVRSLDADLQLFELALIPVQQLADLTALRLAGSKAELASEFVRIFQTSVTLWPRSAATAGNVSSPAGPPPTTKISLRLCEAVSTGTSPPHSDSRPTDGFDQATDPGSRG